MNLKPNPDNPRTISKEAFEQLKAKIQRNPDGLRANKIVYKMTDKENGYVVAGNQRLRAINELKLEQKPEWFLDATEWTDEQIREYLVTSNVSDGTWDWDLLLNEYEAPELEEWGLEVPDWKDDTEVEEDEAPEVSSEPPVSKLGEVYKLGRHFVMCGDSTDNADISKLLSGAEIELLLTDPPYNLGFSYNQYDDNKTLEEYEKLLSKAIYDIDVPKKIVTPGKQNLFSAYKLSRVTDVGIWYSKNKMSGGKISNLSLWEPLVFIGDFDRNTRATDVLEYTNENQKDTGDHTCPKTVKLFTELLKYSSTNSNVLDTFIGSGTTLIACEQTDRTCYGMELDPKYVDVIRKRYAKFTNNNELPDNWEELTPVISERTA